MENSPVRRLLALGVALIALAGLAGACGDSTDATGGATGDTAPAVEPSDPAAGAVADDEGLRRVEPTATGADVSPAFGDHLVGAPTTGARGELFVFLPGTGARPDFYQSVLLHARDLGYHVIGLAYPNDLSVNFDLCGGDRDPACAEAAREEVLFGTDAPGLALDVAPVDTVVERLTLLLGHLGEDGPAEGWDRYLSESGEPEWSRIATAGHSQGGGHAAYLGRDRELARIVLFDATEPAPWTTEPFETPADRMWGLAHRDEVIVAPIQRSWAQLGLPGDVVEIEQSAAPWGGSHRLLTSTDECRGDPTSRGYHHNCPVVDGFLPDPIPASLLAAWDQVLTG